MIKTKTTVSLNFFNKIMSCNLIYIPVFICFIYQVKKGLPQVELNPAYLIPFFALFIKSFIHSQKNILQTILTLSIFSALFFRHSPLEADPLFLISTGLFALSQINFKYNWVLLIPCFFLAPQYSVLFAFMIAMMIIKNNKIKKFIYFIPSIILSALMITSFSSVTEIVELFKDIFDGLFKPMNVMVLLGICLLGIKERFNFFLLAALLISSIQIHSENSITAGPNLISLTFIAIIFGEFLRYHDENSPLNNLLLFSWLLFGGLF